MRENGTNVPQISKWVTRTRNTVSVPGLLSYSGFATSILIIESDICLVVKPSKQKTKDLLYEET